MRYFIDKINDYRYKISYNSFFQINPFVSSKLFELINNYAKKSRKVIDLYSGVGTLSINASNRNVVTGVEVVKNAVDDAEYNKLINNKTKINFICSDTKNILTEITKNSDLIILDPPRAGVNKNVLDQIKKKKIKKIIYVSCNPFTLIRDLKILESHYEIEDIKVLDMFPYTKHIETIVLLSWRCR